jgi:hypothetical protein
MKKFLLLAALTAVSLSAFAADSKDGWISLFDGKSLDGWKASDKPGTFSVENGEIVIHGERSHLFYLGDVHGHDFKNFEVKADVMARKGSNSGFYFHTAWQEAGWPDKGFEVQVNNTHKDPKKTAGLYDIVDNYEAPAKDDEWFTLYIKVEGKHVITKVNDKVIVDYTEPEGFQPKPNHPGRKIDHGTFALQGHDPGSEVHFKNIFVKPLP